MTVSPCQIKGSRAIHILSPLVTFLQVSCTVVRDHASIDGGTLGQVTWYGVTGTPQGVTVNGTAHSDFRFYSQTQVSVTTFVQVTKRASVTVTVYYQL